MEKRANNIIQKMYSNDAFSKWMGIQILEVSEGFCKISMSIKKDMLNGFGTAHGGICYSFADSALGFASNSHGKKSVSVDTQINHIEPLLENDTIVATASEDSLKNKLGFYTIQVHKGDLLVALFKGVVYRTSKTWDI